MPILRPFEEKDQNQAMKLFYQLTGTATILDAAELLADQAVECIVIEEDGIVAGFASLIKYYLPTGGKVGKIEDVIVDENFRGKGLGRKLIEELVKIAKENNLKKLQLTSSPSRVAARELYKSVGFEMKDTNVFVMNL
jgi:ribosomal protein S18 acetylase RimI-like enzyme